MLSILIPVYNYNVAPLVKELQEQCLAIKDFEFEILVMDDGSELFYQENNQINDLENCSYIVFSKNSGLAHTRNQLITASKYKWLLLLDSDVFPTDKNYILNYLQQIQTNSSQIYFGGICYQKNKPSEQELLRWIYGLAREEKSAKERSKKKSHIFLSSNTLFAKQIFSEIRYDDSIVQYGYEDLLFSKHALEKGFEVKHLDNAVWHLKLDSSQEYLQKVHTSMHTLQLLIKEKKLNWNDTGISKLYHDFKRYKLASCFLFIANVFNLENRLERNLLSRNPKVKYLDWYRLLLFTRLFR